MDIKHGIPIKGFLWTTPVVTGLCVAISASSTYAATFALSQGQVEIAPISHSAFLWGATTEANTFAAASPEGKVAAIASASAQGMNTNLGGLHSIKHRVSRWVKDITI